MLVAGMFVFACVGSIFCVLGVIILCYTCFLGYTAILCGLSVMSAAVVNVYRGFLAVDHTLKRLVLAFRGSVGKQAWYEGIDSKLVDLVDFADVTVNGRPVTISSYFLNAYSGLHASIFEDMLKYTAIYPDYTIYMTGHSLGGALASISPVYAMFLSITHTNCFSRMFHHLQQPSAQH